MLFDRLLLLADGNTIYQGPASDCVSHFAKIGFVGAKFSNPADIFMKAI